MDYSNPIPNLEDDNTQPISLYAENSEIDNYSQNNDIYFAFIDVLGFKQTFDENRNSPPEKFAERYKTAFKYYRHLIYSTNLLNSDQQNSTNICEAGQTSDSLYFYTNRLDFLEKFIYMYWHFSVFVMSENVFFRGGIAKGNLFIGKPWQFYGDSVIKAYLLESNIAKFPRLAIDQQTKNDLSNNKEILNQIVDENGRFFLKPFSDFSFQDILQRADLNSLQAKEITSELLKKVRGNIESNKNRFEFDEKNYRKYSYLLDQFEERFDK